MSFYFSANLNRVIIIVIGDENCQDGDSVSDVVQQVARQLASSIKLEANKITVMSWRKDPFLAHQDIMKDLLLKYPPTKQPYPSQYPSSTQQQQYYGDPAKKTPTNKPPTMSSLPKKSEFDRTKGYLRYRAVLEYGRLREVERYPTDWHPEQRDIHDIVVRNTTEPKAVLEIWADSYDGPTKNPILIKPEKGNCFSMFASLFHSKK